MNNLKQLKCPSCGAGLSLNSPYELVMECPHCHSQVINESVYQSKDNSVESTVLPFSWTEEKVMKSFSDHLVGLDDTPTDVFAKMQITSLRKYYVPMYVFHGSYRAPWTAKVPRFQKRVGLNNGQLKETQDIVYDYVNGEAVGNFSFNSIPEKEIQDIGIDLSLLQNVSINTAKCIPLSSLKLKQEDNIKFLSPSGNADVVWSESAQEMAQNEAYAAAMNQCPKSPLSNTPSLLRNYMEHLHNFRVEIVSCSASCEMRKASLVFIPIWRIDYKYQDKEYNFILYAEQKEKWTSFYPKETGTVQANATDEQQAMLDEYEKEVSSAVGFMTWGCGGLLVAEILTIFGVSSFFETLKEDNWGWYFPVAGIIVLIIYFVIEQNKKSKYEIDAINADIADRTEKMVQASMDYKKQTSVSFLQSKMWENETTLNAPDLTNAFTQNIASLKTAEEPSHQTTPLYNKTMNTNLSTKYCKHCGKKIDASHNFCRYCGSKQ